MAITIGTPEKLSEDNWLAFRASVDELNAYQKPFVLRKYQSEILHSGGFSVISPISGRHVEVTRSIALGNCIAYLIPGNSRSWLVAGSVGNGFPFYEVVTELDGRRHSLEATPKPWNALRPKHLTELFKFDDQKTTGGKELNPTLVIGHHNFAHHLWNELSAFDEWLCSATEASLAKLTVLAVAEPLGPLREIFPNLKSTNIIPVTHDLLETHLARSSIAVRVGSRFVTERVRNKIRNFSQHHVDERLLRPLHALLESGWPRIWISVRLGSRTARNMEHFLLSVFQKIFSVYPEAAILLDGFSFPFGFFCDPRTTELRDSFSDRARATDEFIGALCNQAKDQLGASAASRIRSMSGMYLADSIDLGARCDYYICHSGTLQHKIGWFHSVPGFLLLPHSRQNLARWHAAQVERGIQPDTFSEGLLAPSAVPSTRGGSWNSNFEFADAEGSAQCVVDAMRARLTQECRTLRSKARDS